MPPPENEQRNKASYLAETILNDADDKKRRFTEADVLEIWRTCAFRQNDKRKNVMKEGVEWVHSDTLGLVRFQTDVFIVAEATCEWPCVTRICARWLREQCFEEPGTVCHCHCTSISVNKNYVGKLKGPSSCWQLSSQYHHGAVWL